MGDDKTLPEKTLPEETLPKKRRSRSELRELMIDGGVEVLDHLGVEVQISSVSYARVFEHLERTRGVRVTYGSIHERIWDSLQDYQLSVLERAGTWHAADTDDTDQEAWNDWVDTAIALTSGPADSPVTIAAIELARAAYAQRATRPGSASGSGDDDALDPAQRETLRQVSDALDDGLRLRARLTGSGRVSEVRASELQAADDRALRDLVQGAVSRTLHEGGPTSS